MICVVSMGKYGVCVCVFGLRKSRLFCLIGVVYYWCVLLCWCWMSGVLFWVLLNIIVCWMVGVCKVWGMSCWWFMLIFLLVLLCGKWKCLW